MRSRAIRLAPVQVYSTAPAPGRMCPVAMRRMNAAAPAQPDFDALDDDDDAPNASELGRAAAARPGDVAQRSALWPPGRCARLFRPRRADTVRSSPDDPRYGRAASAGLF